VLGEQFVGGIHAAGPDPTIATVSGPPARASTTGAASTGASFDVGGTFSPGERSGERGIERNERQLLRFRAASRARSRPTGHALTQRAAVHTRGRVDVEHLGGGEARLVR